MMAQPPDPTRRHFASEESFLDLLVETLESVDRPVRAQFLQRFFRTIAQLDLPEATTLELWDRIIARRSELSESLNKAVSLKTAMVDVLSSSNYLRVPILVEYAELKKLQISAATDPLTGLYNRRLFHETFEKELQRAKRYPQHLSLVLIDLHRFKEVNDRHGHPQGDLVLQAAAGTLRKTLRTSDYAFRIGGDEFAVLLPQADSDQAATLARRVRASFESSVAGLKLDVPVALDFGLAVFPEDGEVPDHLIRIADQRLYALKNATRLPPSGRIIPAQPSEEPERQRERETVPERMPPRRTPPAPLREPVREPIKEAAKPEPPPVSSIAGGGSPPPPARTAAPAAPPSPAGKERRRWERISLAGTRARAEIADGPSRTARVIDLSFGGVALQVERYEDLPNTFFAVLHVPILPPVRVSLRKAYATRQESGAVRVGCAFTN